MLTAHIGILKYVLLLAVLVLVVFLIIQNSSMDLKEHLPLPFHKYEDKIQGSKATKTKPGQCGVPKTCSNDHFHFYISSGAASVVKPKICLQNKIIVGSFTENAGEGINIAVINGQTGDVIKTGHFNMYDGETEPLIELLQSIEMGSVVFIASFDDPSTKLNDEARKLIGELGSSLIKSVAFRDNWIFAGGKGVDMQSAFEELRKNTKKNNVYEDWPEIIEMEGCMPKYLQ